MDVTRPLVVVDHVSRRYGSFIALDSVSMTAMPGEVVALVGPNGAGKTTLLSILAGWSRASEGTVQVGGNPPSSIEGRRILAFTPDTPVFYGDITVREHVEFIAALHGVFAEGYRGDVLLEQFGLAERGDSFPHQLSRGMRQKLSLVLALVRPFEVLLLDEPFANLDADSVEVLLGLVRGFASSGAAVILVSHQELVHRIATRVVALADGVLTESAAVGGAVSRPG